MSWAGSIRQISYLGLQKKDVSECGCQMVLLEPSALGGSDAIYAKVLGNTGWLPYCASMSFVRRRPCH